MCVDPDPPGYEKGQYWLHWLVSNVKGDDLAKGDLTKAKHSLRNYHYFFLNHLKTIFLTCKKR